MLKVTVDNKAALAHLAGLGQQIKYATARALTATAKEVQRRIPAALEKDLDRPTEFTKRGTFVIPARKDKLEAVVGFKDRQASYLKWQIEGGSRSPSKKALRLPSAIGLDQHGNLPKGVIQKLIAVARKESKMAKRTSRRIKVSSKLDIFYGDPKDVGGHRFPPGIYKIVKNGMREQMVPLVVFPQKSARYKHRFKFYEMAEQTIREVWANEFEKAIAEAIRTAR
jgi:hypothetical protein